MADSLSGLVDTVAMSDASTSATSPKNASNDGLYSVGIGTISIIAVKQAPSPPKTDVRAFPGCSKMSRYWLNNAQKSPVS